MTPLDEAAVRAALRRLGKQGIESLAVVFMFSFVNPAHERRVREIAAEECPRRRRLAVARGDAVGARVRAHQHDAGQRLRRAEDRALPAAPGRPACAAPATRRELLVMQSNGGIMTPEYIVHRPVTTLSSGPTGGVIAACAVGRAGEHAHDFVCADMGGTSYDVCLIRGGEPEVKSGWNWHHRYLVGLPMVDIHSIGAGGGSIASGRRGLAAGRAAQRRRAARARSATAAAAREMTVTDANLLLGYLNAGDFCGGAHDASTRPACARRWRRRSAKPLGLGCGRGGARHLPAGQREHGERHPPRRRARGVDPRRADDGRLRRQRAGARDGAGGRAAASATVLVPKMAPAFSALGLQLSDHLVDEMRAYIAPVGEVDLERVNTLFSRDGRRRRAAVLGGRRGQHSRLEVRRFDAALLPGADVRHDRAAGGGERTAHRQRISPRRSSASTPCTRSCTRYASRDEQPILRGVRLTLVGVTEKPQLPTRRPLVIDSRRSRAAARRYFGGKFVATPDLRRPEGARRPSRSTARRSSRSRSRQSSCTRSRQRRSTASETTGSP